MTMEYETYLRFILALVFVLGLIGLLTWMARRYGFGGRLPGRARRVRRIEVVETRVVDGKRRLVLVRRDDVEHLVLLGATSETLIEQGIEAAPADAPPAVEGSPPESAPLPRKAASNPPKAKQAPETEAKPTLFKDEVAKRMGKAGAKRSAKA